MTECDAKVVSIDGTKVKLDRTIFFAFSGGQESDKGTIGGVVVTSAVKERNREGIVDITYELEKEPFFAVGDTVLVSIDGGRRERLRRLHSAAHVVYYFIIAKLGELEVIGSNIASDKARLDFLYEHPLNPILTEIEKLVNIFLSKNHKIVSEPDSTKSDLRWWVCNGWRMPCGGTHPRSTGEIGNISLKRKNLGASKERVEIVLC